jgi:DNA recombination protein RmuC
MALLLISVIAAGIGFAIGAIWSKSRSSSVDVAELATLNEQLRSSESRVQYLENEHNTLGHQAAELRERAAVLEAQLEFAHQREKEQTANEERLTAEFERLARTTLKESKEELVKVAENSFKLAQQKAKGDFDQQQFKIENLVRPVQENLDKLEAFIQSSEKVRNEQFGGLFEQMQSVAATSKAVQAEAASLKNVLRSSTSTRGRWGEIQLRRVVELAGMAEHVDFTEQSSVTTDDGRSRADLIVYMPGGVQIAVDAKVPYNAYEQAHSSEDAEEQKRFLIEHAKQFRAHVDALAKRAYWDQYLPSCGFSILFVPGDALLDAALMHDPSLHEAAIEKRILLATPTSLIPMLRLTSVGWARETQAENAAEIARTGKELLKRLTKANGDLEKMGRGLKMAVGSYNDFVGTYESRIHTQAIKLSKLSGVESELKRLNELSDTPRHLRKHSESDQAELLEITEHSEAS